VVWWGSGDRPTLVEAGEYAGEDAIAVSATQLNVSSSQAKRVVDGWIELLASGPTLLRSIQFTSRTPARLFEALRGQTQLESLEVKWGDYSDLSALSEMTRLRHLVLLGARSVTSVDPLASLTGLETLELDGCERLRDLSPLGQLHSLVELTVEPSLWSSRQRVSSIDFLRGLRRLRRLRFAPLVESRDYSAVLELTDAAYVSLDETEAMAPSMIDLEWAVPGVSEALRPTRPIPLGWSDRTRGVRGAAVTGAELSTADAVSIIDAVWSDLLAGFRSRLEVMRWARELRVEDAELTGSALAAIEGLAGRSWQAPKGQELERLSTWLEGWRRSAAAYLADPAGEPRREALRVLTQTLIERPQFLEATFAEYVEEGAVGPDDAALFNLSWDG
jgi:ribosome modulation factor